MTGNRCELKKHYEHGNDEHLWFNFVFGLNFIKPVQIF